MERVIENNKLIAEFMGLGYEETIEAQKQEMHDLGYMTPEVIESNYQLYHNSWDWLMPVYKKMRDFLQNMERPSRNHCCKGDMIELDASCALTEVNIEGVYKHIVDFINWHNEYLLSTDKTKTV